MLCLWVEIGGSCDLGWLADDDIPNPLKRAPLFVVLYAWFHVRLGTLDILSGIFFSFLFVVSVTAGDLTSRSFRLLARIFSEYSSVSGETGRTTIENRVRSQLPAAGKTIPVFLKAMIKLVQQKLKRRKLFPVKSERA